MNCFRSHHSLFTILSFSPSTRVSVHQVTLTHVKTVLSTMVVNTGASTLSRTRGDTRTATPSALPVRLQQNLFAPSSLTQLESDAVDVLHLSHSLLSLFKLALEPSLQSSSLARSKSQASATDRAAAATEAAPPPHPKILLAADLLLNLLLNSFDTFAPCPFSHFSIFYAVFVFSYISSHPLDLFIFHISLRS